MAISLFILKYLSQAGNLEAYCNLMIELGEWQQALSIAPAVSHQFWAKLASKQAQALLDSGEQLDNIAPLLIASNRAGQLAERLESDGRYEDAFVLASTEASGGFGHLQLAKEERKLDTIGSGLSLGRMSSIGEGTSRLEPLPTLQRPVSPPA